MRRVAYILKVQRLFVPALNVEDSGLGIEVCLPRNGELVVVVVDWIVFAIVVLRIRDCVLVWDFQG